MMIEESQSKTFPVAAQKGKCNGFQFSLTVTALMAI